MNMVAVNPLIMTLGTALTGSNADAAVLSNAPDQDQGVRYTLTMEEGTPLHPSAFQNRLHGLMNGKKLVSFGEEHDGNRDPSFAEVLGFKDIIFPAYSQIVMNGVYPNIATFLARHRLSYPKEDLIRFILFVEKLLSPSVEDVMAMSASRVFASTVMPVAHKMGYTDLVLEGFFERDPEQTLELSKDRIGLLLIMTATLCLGIHLHGTDSGHVLFSLDQGKTMADALRVTIDGIFKENPNARVLSYNGGLHNMTVPIQGRIAGLLGHEIDLSQMTFAPHYMAMLGREFLSVDLVTPSDSQQNHFALLRERAIAGRITEVPHSKGQVAFVFPPK